MTHEDDFIQQLEGYLDEYEGTTPLPDEVRHAVRAQLPTTRQIGPVTGPMRDLMMSNVIRVGLVAAVAAVIAVIAFNLLPGSPPAGGEQTPTPEPSAAASATSLPGARHSGSPGAGSLSSGERRAWPSTSRSPFPPAGAPAKTGW